MPLSFEPGQGWQYSLRLDWAGKMIERVTNNVHLGDYLAKNIWKPLGMNSTTFRPADRPDLKERMCGMRARLPSSEAIVSPP